MKEKSLSPFFRTHILLSFSYRKTNHRKGAKGYENHEQGIVKYGLLQGGQEAGGEAGR